MGSVGCNFTLSLVAQHASLIFNMEKTPAFIDSNNTKEFLFTYDENEKQEHEINKSNANLIFSPEFIPYRIAIKKKFNLTHIETLMYGFIRFYKSNGTSRFYFTNKQMSEIVDCSESIAARGMSNLIRKGLLKAGYKVKGGGGKVRFINALLVENGSLDYAKMDSLTTQKQHYNNNKIKYNKKNYNNIRHVHTYKGETESEGTKDMTALKDILKQKGIIKV